jgi:hypothetical protein
MSQSLARHEPGRMQRAACSAVTLYPGTDVKIPGGHLATEVKDLPWQTRRQCAVGPRWRTECDREGTSIRADP